MAKELKWRGMSEAQVKELEWDAFLKLLPARRRRSLTRERTDDQKALLKKIEAGERNIKTHSRNMVVIPAMLGQTIHIHSGKTFVPITITLEMLGHCLGEFAPSRKMVSHSSAGVGSTRSSKAVSAR